MRTDPASPLTGDDLRVRLAAMIGAVTSSPLEALRVTDLKRTSGGLSRENWTFSLEGLAEEPGAIPLILRRDPAGSLLDTDRRVEYDVLKALEKTHLPTPAARWADMEGHWLGAPSLVMDRVDGYCDWHALNSDAALSGRLALAHAFLSLLTDIQAVDWKSIGLADVLPDPGAGAAMSALLHWETVLRDVALEPMPELDLVLGWLRARASPSDRTVLVHGDFKPGNALIRDGAITAILDWETVHLGDPLEDLGWITNPARRDEHQIPGAWQRDDIVEAYTRITGSSVDDSALRWWNVFSCWKLAIIVLTGVHAYVDGRFEQAYQYPGWLVRHMIRLIEED